MKTYENPSAKVLEINPDTLICISPSNPDANSSTEKLVEDELKW